LAFWQWQRLVQGDYKSKAITATTEWAKGLQPYIILNDSAENQLKKIPDGVCFDIDGKIVTEAILLSPFSSKVILCRQMN
jgi:hypothetical protein